MPALLETPAGRTRYGSGAERLSTAVDVATAVQDAARYVVSTMTTGRTDRLWPSDLRLSQTNPLSVGYGACGTALFLNEALGELPPEVRTWLLKIPADRGMYPPGLYLGASGVAWTFQQLGLHDRAREFMEIAYESPLLFADPVVLLGAAGWGLTSLFLYHQYREQHYLDWAVRAGTFLLETRAEADETCYWRHSLDGRVHFGYAFGASGIAHFLLELAIATGRDDFREVARRALQYDISNRIETANGWKWSKYSGAELLEPYWLHGSAGVGAAAARFLLLDPEGINVAEICRRIVSSVSVKFTLSPGQWEGMSGIGEFFVDMYLATGQPAHLDQARELASTILWFAVQKPEGIAFPGRMLSRVSMDYANGAAGVGLFLHRLANPGPRPFLDVGWSMAAVAPGSA